MLISSLLVTWMHIEATQYTKVGQIKGAYATIPLPALVNNPSQRVPRIQVAPNQ